MNNLNIDGTDFGDHDADVKCDHFESNADSNYDISNENSRTLTIVWFVIQIDII